jgi:hypothetical protein
MLAMNDVARMVAPRTARAAMVVGQIVGWAKSPALSCPRGQGAPISGLPEIGIE